MSFLDLYQGDQDQAAKIQPTEGTRLPSTAGENFEAAWADGRIFGQSIAQQNARSAVLDDYLSEIKQKTGNDIRNEMSPEGSGPTMGLTGTFDAANARVAKIKESYPDLDLDPLSDDEIDKRAVAKAQAAHRDYQALQEREKGPGGSLGSFLGSAAASATDPINILALGIAPETGGSVSILSAALRWGALAGTSQAAIEASSNSFKEQVQPGYTESGAPLQEIAGAAVGGAVLGGGFRALGNAWSRVKTGAWPTSVRDAGNVIESEANVAQSNIFPGVEGEVAHREALTKTIDDILANRPVDVSAQITPDLQAHFDAYHGSPHDFDTFDLSKQFSGEGSDAYGSGVYLTKTKEAAEFYQNLKGQGTLYTTKVSGDESRFIDWDKPVSGQSEHVQSYLKSIGVEGNDLSGHELQTEIANKVLGREIEKRGGDWQSITPDIARRLPTQDMIDAGILGNKYESGSGNKNYVVFDSSNIQITHKNGKPVAAEIRQAIVDKAAGLPPKQPELDLQPPTGEPTQIPPPKPGDIRFYHGTAYDDASEFSGSTFVTPHYDYAKNYHGSDNNVLYADFSKEEAIKRGLYDEINGFPRHGPIDDGADVLKPHTIRKPIPAEPGPQPAMQTPDDMTKTLTAPDHQEAIRADIDRARAMSDVQVPGVDENGNHTMVSIDKAMDDVDAYKAAAEHIQACANPVQEAAA
jgi:hypothetical protein